MVIGIGNLIILLVTLTVPVLAILFTIKAIKHRKDITKMGFFLWVFGGTSLVLIIVAIIVIVIQALNTIKITI